MKPFLRSLHALWACCLLGAVPVPAAASTYYAATNGSNATGDGSSGNPWATPGYASKQLAAGDTLIIRGGTYVMTNYYSDIVWMDQSGASNAWITVRGEDGARPVLKGVSNISHAVNIADRTYLRIENLEMCSLLGSPFPGGMRTGVNGLGSYGQSNIVLRDLEIYHVTEGGIALDGNISNVVVENCRVHHTGYTAISGDYVNPGDAGWQNVLITNCLLEHAGLFNTNGLEEPSGLDRPDGVGFEASTGPVVIARTTARYGFGDGLDSKAQQTRIHHCVVANNYGDGVKLWGGNSALENTLVYGTGFTISNAVTPWCLLVIGTRNTNAAMRVEHCTFFDDERRANDHYTMTVQYDESATPIDLTFRNNLFAGLGDCWIAGAVNLTAEHNLFYCRADDVQVEHGASTYTTGTIGTLGTSNRYANPLFVNAEWGAAGDFRLRPGSPALDAGLGNALRDDVEYKPRPVGGVPDLGAYESAQYADGCWAEASRWVVASGAAYRAEFATALAPGIWSNANGVAVATDFLMAVSHTNTGAGAGFYRVVTAP